MTTQTLSKSVCPWCIPCQQGKKKSGKEWRTAPLSDWNPQAPSCPSTFSNCFYYWLRWGRFTKSRISENLGLLHFIIFVNPNICLTSIFCYILKFTHMCSQLRIFKTCFYCSWLSTYFFPKFSLNWRLESEALESSFLVPLGFSLWPSTQNQGWVWQYLVSPVSLLFFSPHKCYKRNH